MTGDRRAQAMPGRTGQDMERHSWTIWPHSLWRLSVAMPSFPFGPPRGLTLGLYLAAASTLISSVAWLLSDDMIIDLANGWLALIISISAGYRLCFGRDRTFLGWLLTFIVFDLFALAELSGGRLEALEHRLRMESFDDITLLISVLIALLAVWRRERLATLHRRLLALGFLAHALSTSIDLFEDWLVQVSRVGIDDLDIVSDLSEFVFLQLYLIGIVGHVFASRHIRRRRERQVHKLSKPADA